MAPLTEHEIEQRHAWMAVALRDMPHLDDVLDRVCAQAHEANDLRAALQEAVEAIRSLARCPFCGRDLEADASAHRLDCVTETAKEFGL